LLASASFPEERCYQNHVQACSLFILLYFLAIFFFLHFRLLRSRTTTLRERGEEKTLNDYEDEIRASRKVFPILCVRSENHAPLMVINSPQCHALALFFLARSPFNLISKKTFVPSLSPAPFPQIHSCLPALVHENLTPQRDIKNKFLSSSSVGVENEREAGGARRGIFNLF
jgi:hypothetical protein